MICTWIIISAKIDRRLIKIICTLKCNHLKIRSLVRCTFLSVNFCQTMFFTVWDMENLRKGTCNFYFQFTSFFLAQEKFKNQRLGLSRNFFLLQTGFSNFFFFFLLISIRNSVLMEKRISDHRIHSERILKVTQKLRSLLNVGIDWSAYELTKK